MNPCENCALRLFNTKHHKLDGVGNPYFGNLIVVPNVDYTAYKKGNMSFSTQVEIIKEIISSSTGELDNLFILPLIRCSENLGCKINEDIIKNCLYYYYQDVRKYNFKHILLLGKAGGQFIDGEIKNYLDTVIVNINNGKCFNINYSPLVKYTNDELFIKFKHYLIKWYNYAVKGYYSYNNIIHI